MSNRKRVVGYVGYNHLTGIYMVQGNTNKTKKKLIHHKIKYKRLLPMIDRNGNGAGFFDTRPPHP